MANINVKVNADTSTARQALQDLQRQLDQLSNPTKLTNSTMNSELLKAAQAAEVLKTQLTEATNVNTGRLDLSKFTQQLSQSGMSLEKYQQYFKSFGVEGQKAFSALATSIAQAEIPLKNMNTMTQKMWTSIKNTINWQISSSLIHGIVGQFSTMVNYAKDLDKSLNNIQIVTGASAQKMTQFAQQANQAAKQLNTTTTAYTNASLIYYQQGLSDKEVKARTDVTVKLANVTKESVTDVSNQLTAIWNNFAEGSSNLEHFADVITALGAATASSSKEIATGLEKFASIADTVGLSYEKATAALATVTAKTRQSADTVGTGFRTIFSRLQSLSLGETLEDGVNLTKYTKALKTIGVQALDTSGNLRSMDNIIMDVGEKWEKLTDSQKMAFANTVGGVRQYATLVALFDDFDQFKANLSIAETSDGTLQNQAEIFADSWEAASKRVRATAEGIYGRLIKSDDFESLMDTFSGFLEMIQGIIDGLGGLQGVLLTLGAIATTVFGKQISTGLDNMGLSILTMGGLGEKRLMNIQKKAVNMGIETWSGNDTRDQAKVLSKKNEAADNLAYLTYGSKMNTASANVMRSIMDYNRKLYAQQEIAGENAFKTRTEYTAKAELEEQERYNKQLVENAKKRYDNKPILEGKAKEEYNRYAKDYENWQKGILTTDKFKAQYGSYFGLPTVPQTPIQLAGRADELIRYSHSSQLKNILGLVTGTDTDTGKAAAQWRNMRAAIKDTVGVKTDANGKPILDTNGKEQINYEKFFAELGDLGESATKAAAALDAMEAAAKQAEEKAKADNSDNPDYTDARKKANTEDTKEFEEKFDKTEAPKAPKTEADKSVVDAERKNMEARGNAAQARDNLLKYGEEQSKIITGGEAISKIAGAAASAASAVMMLSNAFQVLGDDTASSSQRLGAVMSIIMSLGTAIPAVTGLIASMGKTVTLVGTEISLAFWQVTLIAAVIGGLIAAYAYAKSQEDTDAKKLKRTQETARELNDAYKEAKSQADDLKSAFDNYDSVYDALQNCIKYSDEWYEALNKVNNQVLDMIQQFPELAGMVGAIAFDKETGLYTITDEGRKEIESAYAFKELQARAASIKASQIAVNTSNEIDLSDTKDVLRKLFYNEAVGSTNLVTNTGFFRGRPDGYGYGKKEDLLRYGEGLEDLIDGSTDIRMWVGELLSQALIDNPDQLTQYLSGNLSKYDFSSALLEAIWSNKTLQNYVQEQFGFSSDTYTKFSQTAEDMGIEIDQTLKLIVLDWFDALKDANILPDVAEIQKETNINTRSNLTQNRLLISQGLKTLYPEQTYSQATIDILANSYDKTLDTSIAALKEILAEPGRTGTKDNWDSLKDTEVGQILQEFIKLNGEKYSLLTSADTDVITGNDNQRVFNLALNSTGNQVGVSIDTIAAMVATSRYMESLGGPANDIENLLTKIDSSIDKQNKYADNDKDALKQAVYNFLSTGEFGNILSGATITKMGQGFDLLHLLGLSSTDQDKLFELLGIDKATFQANSQKQYETMKAQYEDNKKAFMQASGITEQQLNSTNLAYLNGEQLGALRQRYTNIATYGGENSDFLITTLNSLFTNKNLSPDKIMSIADLFATSDWTSLDAVGKIISSLQELLGNDYAAVFDGIDITPFLTKMRQVEVAANGINITGFVKAMEGISSLLSSLTLGSIISKKDIDEKYANIDFSKIGYTDTQGNVTITADEKTARKEILSQYQSLAQQQVLDAQTAKYGRDANIPKTQDTNLIKASAEEYIQDIQSILDYIPYELLDQFLKDNIDSDDILKLAFTDRNALKQKALINSANMRGYDIAEIQKEAAYRTANASYYRTGEYSDIYEAQAEVIKEKDALAEAEKLRLDTASIQAEAQRLWDHGEGGYKSYTEALEGVIKKESELFGFRKEMTQEANDWNINYDDVIEYAKQLRDIGEFDEDQIEASERFALGILKQNAAIETISNNYQNWLKIINDKDAVPDSVPFESAIYNLKQSLLELFNLSKKDTISDLLLEWAKDAGNLKKLLSGDKGAWGKAFGLQAKAALEGLGKLDQGTIDKWTAVAEQQANMKQGQDLDPQQVSEFVDEMARAGATVDEINAAGRQVFNTTDDVLTEIGQTSVEAGQSVDDVASSIEGIPEDKQVYIEQNTNPPSTEEVELGGESDINGEAAATGTGILSDSGGSLIVDGTVETSGTATVLAANGKVTSKGTPDGKKGGGGGGGKKPHKPKRYRVIENKIQDNDRNKERISRDKDRAFGTAKLDLLKQQRDLEKENLKLQQQYLSEIDEWLGKDKQDLIEKMAKINFTPEFDENGIMTNMDEFEAAWAKLADGSDEAWTEAGEALDQYQETLAKYKDKLKELEEIQQAIFDSFLEETQLEVEMKINVNTANIEYIDYLLGKIEDDAYQAAEAIALLGHKTGEIEIQASVYRKGINDILSHHTLADGTQLSLENIGSMTTDQLLAAGFTDAEIQELQKYRSELLQLNQQLLEMHDTVTNKVIDSLQKMDEEVQKSYDNFDHYNSVLEHYKNINDLINIGNNKLSKELTNKLNRAMLSNAQTTASAAHKIYDNSKQIYDAAKTAYDNAVASGVKENIKHQKQILDAATEQFQEAENQWLEAWEGALEQAKAIFETAIQDIVDTYNEQMGSTFGSLDYLQAAYDRQKETNEQYLQDYDRLYELSKLSRDISKSIDDTDSIKGKQKLRDIQAEINKLQADGTKLSQYDIEALQKKYELEKARLALEDVQNAKQTVRLQRDSEGNWGYVYTADEDKVAEAEQEYEDKLHEYQKLNDEYIQELQDKVLSAQATYRDLIQEIMSDTTLTDEQRQARLEEVQNWYNEQINFFGQQLTNALHNQEGTLDRYYQRYNGERAKLVDSWKETTLSLLTGTGSMDDYMAHMRESASQMVETAYQALLQYKQDIDQTDAMAGQDSSFSEMVSGVVSGIGELSTATEASISTLADTMTDEFATALQAAVSWESQYVSEMMQMIAQTEAEVTAVNNLIAALSGLDTTALYAAANATVGAAGAGQASTSAANAAEQAAKATAAYSTNPYYASGEKKMTEDFLHIVNDNMVDCNVQLDDIIRILELQVNAFSEGLGALISAPGIMNEPQDILEQNIHIDVSFPNVTQHSEIEKAFENLVNKAAQYANRKN